jgi:hypothetical protein
MFLQAVSLQEMIHLKRGKNDFHSIILNRTIDKRFQILRFADSIDASVLISIRYAKYKIRNQKNTQHGT